MRLLFLAIIAALSVPGALLAQTEDLPTTPVVDEDSPYENVKVLARAMQLIRQDYVDEHKINYKSLTYGALRGMLAELDPHSQFMDPEDFKGMQEDTRSEFGGLGVVVTLKNGTLTIVNPMEDSPGFTAGLLPGDQILKINGESTDKFELSQAVEKLRGEIGEKITLTIFRPGTKEVKDYELTRRVIKVPSIKDAQILPRSGPTDARIGYLRITQFNEPTAAELGKALDKLEKQGMDALILDLRYNPGGLLGSAVDVCGQFLPSNTRVASTEGRTPGREYRTSTRAGASRKYPVAVLVNYASASGSEIVAGALKDLNRAIIVGETTFGKGSVQSVISLPDGSALRLTTAKYFTPSHYLIHEHGVTPNIHIPLTYDQETQLLRSRRNPEDGDSLPSHDPQLERAMDALRGDADLYQTPHSSGVQGILSQVVLAIETSCDESAVAVLRGFDTPLAHLISSQAEIHSAYGGVVPEVASRNHLQALPDLIIQALKKAGVQLQDCDVFAASTGPGLAAALLVGTAAAKGLAIGTRRPFLAINHIEGHMFSPFFGSSEIPSHLSLVVSGGHTLIFNVKNFGNHELVGRTKDDAAGEAFDKIAKLLGLGYPGGVEIDRLAGQGDPTRFDFPRSMLDSGDYDFSFSGLKTSVRYFLEKGWQPADLPHICASVQEAIIAVLVKKTFAAAQAFNNNLIAISGGVSANSRLRAAFEAASKSQGIPVIFAPAELRTDNALMIAFAAAHHLGNHPRSQLEADILPNYTAAKLTHRA